MTNTLSKNKKSNRTNAKCQHCEKTFETTRGRIRQGSGKFCSNKCRWDYIKGKRIVHECLICKKLFSTAKTREEAKFCSNRCKNKSYQNKYIENKCSECGKTFKKLISSIKSRKGEFCSSKCYNKNRLRRQLDNKIMISCHGCGKNIKINSAKIDKTHGNFCSKNCHMEYRWKTQRSHLIKFVQLAIRNSHYNKAPTYIEKIIAASLEKLKYHFITQKWIYGKKYCTCVDFYIRPKICLYVDGDYWHDPIKNPKVFKRDNRINRGLKKDGYKVVRLKEKTIKKGEKKYLTRLENIRH